MNAIDAEKREESKNNIKNTKKQQKTQKKHTHTKKTAPKRIVFELSVTQEKHASKLPGTGWGVKG